jgi:RimJ/RimL family protein N-acetyltransferase
MKRSIFMGLDGALKLAEDTTPAETEKVGGRSQVKGPIPGIPRYPVELIDVLVLRDGQRITIRPVLPQDDAVTKAFFRSLSTRSRYNRFMRAFHDLPEALLTHFTHVDYNAHLALIAEIFTDGSEIAVGEARYVVSADGKSAEFAVSIADDWQGRGLATLLLSRLITTARNAGVGTITGETLASNAAMLHLARKAGFSSELDGEVAGLVHLSLRLAG